jgi:DNA-binding response OmpR family regulator
MPQAKILLVDDDELIRLTLSAALELSGFAVTTATCAADALKHINSGTYDVLLSDLHMPGAGDGLTVVSAMRHSNPQAATLLLSAFPQMEAAAHAILRQADEILVKPMNIDALVNVIKDRLVKGPKETRTIESVATILERTVHQTIDLWYQRIQTDAKVMAVQMTESDRCSHLAQVFRDLISRLRSSKTIGGKELVSMSAAMHGVTRRKTGYSAAMLVEESRMLQVSIFETLQNNLESIDFSLLLIGVMTIADEIDSQLSQAVASFDKECLYSYQGP